MELTTIMLPASNHPVGWKHLTGGADGPALARPLTRNAARHRRSAGMLAEDCADLGLNRSVPVSSGSGSTRPTTNGWGSRPTTGSRWPTSGRSWPGSGPAWPSSAAALAVAAFVPRLRWAHCARRSRFVLLVLGAAVAVQAGGGPLVSHRAAIRRAGNRSPVPLPAILA